MNKPRILFLARRFTPHVGGVELHLTKLGQLLSVDHEISIVTEQDTVSEPLLETIKGIKVFRIALPRQVTNKLVIWSWVIAHISLFWSADIIHIHDVFFWIIPIYPFLYLGKKKLYITFHGYEGSESPKFWQRFWHRCAARLCRGNICIGGFHEAWYGMKPDVVSFGAVDSSSLKTRPVERKPSRVVRIIFAGRLAQDVGILTYLSGLKLLLLEGKFSLDVYGDGPELEVAKAFAFKFKLPVIFHGFVPHAQIPYANYDLAFVSRYLSILEALSLGLSVIAEYSTAIKHDYLTLSPFAKWIKVVKTPEDIVANWRKINLKSEVSGRQAAQIWAEAQTWKKLADQYLKLWKY